MHKLQLIIGIAFFVGILHVTEVVKIPFLPSEEPAADSIADLDVNAVSDEQLLANVRRRATASASQMVSSFVGQVNGTGFNAVLEPRRIADDPGLQESEQVLYKVRDLIAHFEEINYDRVNNLRDDIDELDIDQDMKDEMMTNVNFHYGGGGEFRQLLKAQDRAVDSTGNVLEVLRDTQGSWSYRASQLKFDRTSDQNKFDSRMARANQVRQELAGYMRKAQR